MSLFPTTARLNPDPTYMRGSIKVFAPVASHVPTGSINRHHPYRMTLWNSDDTPGDTYTPFAVVKTLAVLTTVPPAIGFEQCSRDAARSTRHAVQRALRPPEQYAVAYRVAGAGDAMREHRAGTVLNARCPCVALAEYYP